MAAQRTGVMRAGDPETVGTALWCLVHGLATLVTDGHLAETDARERAVQCVALLDQGLLAR